ncbi:MAG: ATP-binding cassette subfamily F protein 3, partial [Roseivirga sp.]
FKDKVIKEYLGDIDYFLKKHEMENLREAEKRTKVVIEKKAVDYNSKEGREEDKKQKKLQNQLSKVETQISDLEKQIINMDSRIAEEFEKISSEPNFYIDYQAKKDQLDKLMESWSELEEKIN